MLFSISVLFTLESGAGTGSQEGHLLTGYFQIELMSSQRVGMGWLGMKGKKWALVLGKLRPREARVMGSE